MSLRRCHQQFAVILKTAFLDDTMPQQFTFILVMTIPGNADVATFLLATGVQALLELEVAVGFVVGVDGRLLGVYFPA